MLLFQNEKIKIPKNVVIFVVVIVSLCVVRILYQLDILRAWKKDVHTNYGVNLTFHPTSSTLSPDNFVPTNFTTSIFVTAAGESKNGTSSLRPNDDGIKYILQWAPTTTPFDMMGKGKEKFVEYNCTYQNCYVTDKKDFFPSLTWFDALAFSGKHMQPVVKFPTERSPKQKYIFAGWESPHYYPICNKKYDNFFNWTWTYKLNSDFRWGYFVIYDLEGRQVGPKVNMTWPQMDPIGDDLKQELSSKTKVAAWIVSNCDAKSNRQQFVRSFKSELRAKAYGWTVDVYGTCGPLKCGNKCHDMLKRDYYFYFAFENSFAEDYVTEKVLNALNNNAVPVVFGGANYSRFLPPGSYLNARELGVAALAAAMDGLHRNHSAYHEFFRWRNHLRYRDTSLADVCNLCAALNDHRAVRTPTLYKDFRLWWNYDQWDKRDCNW